MPRVILIGPPGSGKSTVGKALAKALAIKFIDSDRVVENTVGKKISEIFIDQGEAAFRDFEFDALTESLEHSASVLSLGGGAPISTRAQDALTAAGIPIVFLDVSLAVAAPRVGFNRDRPLLLPNPRAQWQSLYAVRRPIYEKLATITIKVDSMKVTQIVRTIMEAL